MIKRRLKYTASFFALLFLVLASASVSLLWFGSGLLCLRCVGLDQKKMIVMSAIGVTMWDRLLI